MKRAAPRLPRKVGQRGSAPLAKRRLHRPNPTMRNARCAIVQTTQQHWAADFRVGALSWCGSCKPFLPLTESLICLLFPRDRTRAGTRPPMDLSTEPAPPLSRPSRCRTPVQRKRANSLVGWAQQDDDQLLSPQHDRTLRFPARACQRPVRVDTCRPVFEVG